MDLNVSLNAETGVSFGNVHTLYCAVIATYDVTLTCQSNRTKCLTEGGEVLFDVL